ncbi:MAG: flagellar filament capping protein FliD [Deltaproteobacteria bacterium]|nr:flagellar filament capping protein FliD [Deltaproteobacteria bacterium]
MANYIPGLASGFDWVSMISQLMALERKPITLMENDKAALNTKQSAWNEVNSKLLSLKTAASSLTEIDDFNLYTPSASITGTTNDVDDFLSYAVGSNASQGSYTIKIDNLAQAQKLGSKSFNSTSDALGLEGDILINGRAVNIVSTDGLSNIKNKINALNSGDNPVGVTASIFTVSEGEYRLTLTSQATGSDGIDIANASATDILSQLGIADSTTSVNNTITGGAQSAAFESSTQNIKSLLSLSTTQSGNVTIDGVSISINLATDSLQSIRDTINNNATLQTNGVSASIISDTSSSATTYTLQIDGTQSFVDTDNILQTLGILSQGHSAVTGLTGNVTNTANGSTITEDTLITDIDGYNTWTSGDKITIEGKDHSGGAVGPTDFTITETSTVDDLLSAIESAYSNNVNAYVDGDGAIVVEDNQAGASSLAMTLTPTIGDGNSSLDFGTFNSSTVRNREIVAAEDAQITLDGETITRSTNQITDVITGVTLNLLDSDSNAQITLNIDRDYDGIKSKISDFVSAYNEVITYINEQFEYTQGEDEEEIETPPLFGDSSLLSVKSDIRNVILSGVTGLDSDLDHLSLVGINIDKNGLLSINDSTLDGYLRTNFSDIVNLFVAQGSSTNSNLTYISSDTETVAGSYEVEITQAATQASTTGTGFTGTLSEDTTVTITDNGGRQAEISLSSGWNITSIVNAINSELSQEYEEIRVGENSYYSDADHTTAITSDTKWNSVYDSTGASANLANDDVISFSGTNRSGTEVSGSYTISDVTTETVGDLLNEIEDAFGTGYDAYIDSSGRIAIKDTTEGDSDLTLSIDVVKNLDFGAIDVDPTGADGSKEGRYSMDITAENDSGQLKISNDDYGAYSFTIAVTGGNLGITDGTYSGVNVAGRIREEGSSTWQTMTGAGQTLTGDDDQDVEDLVIKYTGSTTGTFDFDFITGVGEKMDRALYYMTDPYDGYVAGKQDALDTQMDRIDDRIDAAEDRLSRKEEILMNQFVMMERLISQLQSQQQWLTSQINSLFG